MDEDSLKVLLARGLSVEEIGKRFHRNASTVSYWMRKYGLEAPHRDKHAAKGGIARERLEEMIAEGRSIAEIAKAVGMSKGTVRHWLRKYGLRTGNRVGPRPHPDAVAARAAGLVSTQLSCPIHGEVEFTVDTRGCYRCKKCRSEAVSRRRRNVKALLVAESGGRCALCGYDGCLAALAFHHLDPSEKRMTISARGMGVAIDQLRGEASKCVLLCHNCHAEVESGAVKLPIQCAEEVHVPESSPG